MTTLTMRPLEGEEIFETLISLDAYAFSSTPPLPEREEWNKWMAFCTDATFMALFEDDKVVATAVSSPMTQNVRGKIYPMSGLWSVATHPMARRKGYAWQVVTEVLKTVREDGTPFATLYPFRESFYQRLGYIAFPQARQTKFAVNTLAPLLKYDLEGEIELLSIKDGYELYRSYMQKQQGKIHGLGLFDPKCMSGLGERNKFWLAAARIDGEMVGLMLYDLKGPEGKMTMTVSRFFYDGSGGRYLLLEWIARHIDQAFEVDIRLSPAETPETWFADMNVKVSTVYPPMGRVLDVAQMGGMAVGEGHFSARISDPHCPWNEGCYRFEGVDGKLQVTAIDSADCDLTIQGLSGLVYGTHDPESFAIRGWGNPTLELQTTMCTLFPPLLPYLYEIF